jgi:anhydro-N-acetylmuramic acid kinase
MKTIQAIGLMSGTSLDGLDVCCATFTKNEGKWNFKIDCAKGYSYPEEMKEKLGTKAQEMSALEFVTFHCEYGKFLGEKVNEFMKEYGVKPDIIASHGHTIFHEPQKRIMFQIGDGAAIAAETGIDTVSDFRRLDIMLGGQGAPLVPIGDRLLFGDYDYCLNIGGFSNISFEKDGKRIAFDISPVNYVINHYSRQIGLEFDKDGEIAKKGKVDQKLLDELNALPYYNQDGPKSLGREWVEKIIYPMLESKGMKLEDMLRTYYEHAAMQIAKVAKNGKMLITGGGAFNKFLIERIDALTGCETVIPEKQIIDYKEALIFAFLGALYMADEASCLASVTGAKCDNIGGMLFKMKK